MEIHPEGELGLLIPTGGVDGFGGAMVIGPSALQMVGMNLSIVLSWKACSDVLLNGTRTSITETVTAVTTALKTSKSFQSLTTPDTITPDEFRPDGCKCNVLPVVEGLSDVELKWSDTPLLTARAIAIAPLSPLSGTGTSLKPGHEPIVCARKPLSGTVAQNVLEHGTGALNIDGCRIEGAPDPASWSAKRTINDADGRMGQKAANLQAMNDGLIEPPDGRWPANVLLDEQAAAELDEQSGENQPSRFFYVSKAGRGERNAGLDGFEEGAAVGGMKGTGLCRKCGRQRVNVQGECKCEEPDFGPIERRMANVHPTVKPIDLMRWLVRLVCPPGGTCVDPFAGSGTTGIAAVLEGLDFIGIEREAEYVEIARARIEWWEQHQGETKDILKASKRKEKKFEGQQAGQLGLEEAA